MMIQASAITDTRDDRQARSAMMTRTRRHPHFASRTRGRRESASVLAGVVVVAALHLHCLPAGRRRAQGKGRKAVRT
jgi:hypothetical protein